MVPVSRLPDLCLLALFRQMTLQDQIGARKVCRRWADLVPEATIKRRELTLLIGEDSIQVFENRFIWALFYGRRAQKLLLNADGSKMYPNRRFTNWNSLHLYLLDEASAEQIASTFTETKKLQVTARKGIGSMADSLAHLLEQWSHQLVTLQLFDDEKYIYYVPPLDRTHIRLFAAINAQSALKHLHLDLHTIRVPDPLSIVSQLEELHFYSNRTSPQQFVQWLQQYGEGEDQCLARIEYAGYPSDSNTLHLFTSLSEHLCRCFTRYFCDKILDPSPIFANFTNLTSLTLSPFRLTLRQLFTHLATLHQLIHLCLVIDYNSISDDDLEHHHLLPQVKSVKALDLELTEWTPFHQELTKLKLPLTLPNVEGIYFAFHFYRCTECDIVYWRPSVQAKSCLRQLFGPLKRDCTKLRLIEYDAKHYQGTAEELLAE